MFYRSRFNRDISKWDVSHVILMNVMFYKSKFNGDISDWNVSNVIQMKNMFLDSPLEKNPPIWYKK
jgi:surface protein